MISSAFNRGLVVAVAGWFLGAGSTVSAWEVKSHYPTSVDPTMPDAEQAKRSVYEPSGMLRALGEAHRQSMQRGWKGVSPAYATTERPVAE